MKNLFLTMSFALSLAVILSSCEGCEGPDANNNYGTKEMEQKEGETDAKSTPDTVGSTGDVQPIVETIQMQNPSNDAFLKAINAFSAGNMKEAANEIRTGTLLLKKELGETKGMTKQLADKVIKKLEVLDEQVEQGKIKDENDMVTVLSDAEAVTAHNYIFQEVNTDGVGIAPKQTIQHIDTLHLLLDRVNKFERGTNKEKGAALLKENEQLHEQMKSGKADAEMIKKHLKNVKEYLEKRQ